MVLATLLKLLASAFGKGANTGANVVIASKVTQMRKDIKELVDIQREILNRQKELEEKKKSKKSKKRTSGKTK